MERAVEHLAVGLEACRKIHRSVNVAVVLDFDSVELTVEVSLPVISVELLLPALVLSTPFASEESSSVVLELLRCCWSLFVGWDLARMFGSLLTIHHVHCHID